MTAHCRHSASSSSLSSSHTGSKLTGRNNTMAASIIGMDHTYISDEMLEEQRSLPAYETLDHFKNSYDPTRDRENGFWKYYTEKCSKDIS